jgi:hypothetical protein
MHSLQRRRIDMFASVERFCALRADLFPLGSRAHQLLEILTTERTELVRLWPMQTNCKRESIFRTSQKRKERKALLDNMRRMHKTAAFIATAMPQFDNQFKLPRSESDAALLYSAGLFAERAKTSADVFIQFSMPATFLEDMTRQIRNLEQAIASRSEIQKRLKVTTAAINSHMKTCMDTVLKLDIVMANTLRDDRMGREMWGTARHTRRPPVRKKKAAAKTAAT